MAKQEIVEVPHANGVLYKVMDDGLVHTTTGDRAEAERELAALQRSYAITEAIEAGIEPLIEEVCKRFKCSRAAVKAIIHDTYNG